VHTGRRPLEKRPATLEGYRLAKEGGTGEGLNSDRAEMGEENTMRKGVTIKPSS